MVFQVGRVLHKGMKGGLAQGGSGTATLTAFVLISMLEANIPSTVSMVDLWRVWQFCTILVVESPWRHVHDVTGFKMHSLWVIDL